MLDQFNTMVVPIEIKSGKEGILKSLHQFMEVTPHPYAIRIYSGKFSIEEAIQQEAVKNIF